MTTNRRARIRELYETTVMEDLLQKEAGDLEELERELAAEPGAPKTPEKGETVEDLEKELASLSPEGTEDEPEPPKPPEKRIVMPGSIKPGTEEAEQRRFTFVPKTYTPHAILVKTCPVCFFKNRPITLPECKKCKNLYNRMRRKTDFYKRSPEDAVRELSAETSYAYNILKKIWNTLGVTPLTTENVEEFDNPSLSKQVEDMLWYRFNAERDEKTGEPKTDERGLPIPLRKPLYYSTKQLALGLRLTPELFVQKIDEYNTGKDEKDWVRPAYSADIVSDRTHKQWGRYKATYLSIWNWQRTKPAFAEWIRELEEKILPMEKTERTRASIERMETALEDSKSQLETAREQLKLLDETPSRKYLKLLQAFREATDAQRALLEKKYKVTQDKLEKAHGRELDYLLKQRELQREKAAFILESRKKLQEKLEKRKEWLFKLYEKKGYQFTVEKEVAAKEKEAEFKELEAEFGGAGTMTTEEEELEQELIGMARIRELDRLLKLSAKPFQPGLFGDEPEPSDDPHEKLRKMLDPSGRGTPLFQGPQPTPEMEPEPEPEPVEPEMGPFPERGAVPLKPRRTYKDPFGTVKGRYQISFSAVDPVTKEKKTLRGRFEYTPGARSKNVEEALKKRITDKFQALLVSEHGLGPGTYVKALVTDPETRTKPYSFKIGEGGEMVWFGAAVEERRRKRELLEYQPELKSMWVNGLITLDDLVEVDGKLVEKEVFEKGYVEPPAQKLLKPKEFKPVDPHVSVIAPKKRIDMLRRKEEAGIITEDEKFELHNLEDIERDMARIEELSAKEVLTPEEEKELAELRDLHGKVEFDPSIRAKEVPESGEREPVEFTRMCPYQGCGAKIPEDARTCWKCKSPVAQNEIRKSVMKRIWKKEVVEVKNPTTGQVEYEEVSKSWPVFSLVTIKTDKRGRPVAARCEKLRANRPKVKTKGPLFPDIMESLQKALGKIEKDPKYTPKQKQHAKDRLKELYEKKVEEEQSGAAAWGTVDSYKTRAGLPHDVCEDCPGVVKAPFEGACDEIRVVLQSMGVKVKEEPLTPEEQKKRDKNDERYTIEDYEKVRQVKEDPERARRPWVTEWMPDRPEKDDADDGRFARIMELYLTK